MEETTPTQPEQPKLLTWSEPIQETYLDGLIGKTTIGSYNGIIIAKVTDESVLTTAPKRRIRMVYLPFLSLTPQQVDATNTTIENMQNVIENNFSNMIALIGTTMVSILNANAQAKNQQQGMTTTNDKPREYKPTGLRKV